jgi:hypothetical protein
MTSDAPGSRLAREYRRLFLPTGTTPPGGAEPARALVLEVSRPAAWLPLAAVWRGVQADLDLPAPAIAVNGTDGLQLWFSLAEAVDALHGRAWLEGLREEYMSDLPQHRVGMQITPVPRPIPGPVNADGPWSAFVAADLAPLFEESPWLDLAPSEDGQADLLSRLMSIQPASFESALQRLQGTPEATAVPSAVGMQPAASNAGHPAAAQFLLQVMKDEAAPLALRVEAAKALMPYGPSR